jgi:hypothetical protein
MQGETLPIHFISMLILEFYFLHSLGNNISSMGVVVLRIPSGFFRTLFDWVSAKGSVSCVYLHQFFGFLLITSLICLFS